MPQMLGKEVAERVSADRPGISVLYMSGYAELILTSQGTLPPGVTLIEKPFSESQLLAKAREVLDTHYEPLARALVDRFPVRPTGYCGAA
jgi:two-component system, cell cycle sensor histidine kinase and response regulator CckA